MAERRRGVFITFEGTDGCGKSTQFRLLVERLRAEGRCVVATVEPGGTAIGMQIRRILLDGRNQELRPTAELLLYFAARAQNVDELVEPALARGEIVVSDRWTDSTLVYQGAGRRLGPGVVERLDEIACRGLKPDLTVCLEIDLETGLGRAHARNNAAGRTETRMDEQALEFHQRVRDEYRALAAREPERVKTVDARGSVEEVAARVWQVVEPHVR
ncbi:MAG: dTMP kinase [Bryobacteraceae bacterium]|nr:dTMP kinase [Bryobacteraceae bacterium]